MDVASNVLYSHMVVTSMGAVMFYFIVGNEWGVG